MRILLLVLTLAFGVSSLHAATPTDTPTETATPTITQTSTPTPTVTPVAYGALSGVAGKTIVSPRPAVLQSVVIGNTTGDVTVKVFDSAIGNTSNSSLLRYKMDLSPASLTDGERVIPLGGWFQYGITVSTDGQANTLTATWNSKASN